MYKPNIYQDRLGTNTGKTRKRGGDIFFSQIGLSHLAKGSGPATIDFRCKTNPLLFSSFQCPYVKL